MPKSAPNRVDRCLRYEHLDIGTVFRRNTRTSVAQAFAQGQVALSREILNEIKGVALRKFGHNLAAVEADLDDLLDRVLWVRVEGKLRASRDPDDDSVLECARNAGAHFLVTGDHDLLDLKEFEGIRILTASEFLGMVKS